MCRIITSLQIVATSTRNLNRKYTFRLTATIMIIFASTFTMSLQNFVDVQKPAEGASLGLGCNMRLYTYRITQSDAKGIFLIIPERFELLTMIPYSGRECWDHVSVWSCHGRCDSNEISDWKFPYKRSYHPVCMHAGRSKAVAMLRNCHPQASPETRRYEYMEAIGCHCQVRTI